MFVDPSMMPNMLFENQSKRDSNYSIDEHAGLVRHFMSQGFKFLHLNLKAKIKILLRVAKIPCT